VVFIFVGDVDLLGVVLLGALDLDDGDWSCFDELDSLDFLGFGLEEVGDIFEEFVGGWGLFGKIRDDDHVDVGFGEAEFCGEGAEDLDSGSEVGFDFVCDFGDEFIEK
jgi:hypothetical protein